MLLNQSRLSKGLHHKQPLPGSLHLDFVTLFLRHKARWRLVRQLQSQLFYEQFGVWRRLCVAGQNQPTLINRWNPHIDHFDFRHEILQQLSGLTRLSANGFRVPEWPTTPSRVARFILLRCSFRLAMKIFRQDI